MWDRNSRDIKIINMHVLFDEKNFPCKLSLESDDPAPSFPNPESENTFIQVELNELDPVREPPSHNDLIDVQIPDREPATMPEHFDQTEHLDRSTQEKLKDYQLTRDRTRKDIRPPSRYSNADLVYTALIDAQYPKP